MAAITKEDVKNYIRQAPMLELAELVKEIEEEFGVSPMAAMPAMMPGAIAGGEAAKEEEKVAFDVVLAAVGDKKINVIKVVREVTSLGLKEAKDLVDGAPKTVKEGIPKDEAEEVKKKFEAAGATIEVK